MKVKIKKAIYGFSVAMLLMLNVFTFSTINFANEDGDTDDDCEYIEYSTHVYENPEAGICWILKNYKCEDGRIETRQTGDC